MVAEPSGALAGIRVIELANSWGEWCGRLLANLGAEVIKVEPPEGSASRREGPFIDDTPDPDGSLSFWNNNTGKRSVVLDLTADAERAALRRLITDADIFLETLMPAQAEDLGLTDAALRSENPGLITCSITPFGPDGPYAALHTTDLVSMALGGPMQSCGYDGEDAGLPPVRPGLNHTAQTAGHFAVTGVLAALWEREESGLGQRVEIAAHDCLSVTVEFANTHWYYNQAVVRRQSGRHATPNPTARTQYRCADGRYINLALPRNEAAWNELVALLRARGLGEDLENPALMDPVQRFAAGSRAYDLLEVLCAIHTADELFHLGQRLGLTWAAVRAPEDWLDDPHAAARGFFVPVEQPQIGRAVPFPGAPFIAPASPWQVRRAPLLGEHTAAVLSEKRA